MHVPCVHHTGGHTRARRTLQCTKYYVTHAVVRDGAHCGAQYTMALSLYYGTRCLERDDVSPLCAQRLHRSLGRRRPLPLDVGMRTHGGLLHLVRMRLRLWG